MRSVPYALLVSVTSVLCTALLTGCGGGGDSEPLTVSAPAQTKTTATALCPYSESGTQSMTTRGTNATAPTVLTLPFTYSWSCSGTSRTLISNGVPNHPFTGGSFATAISPQVSGAGAPAINASYTLTPSLATTIASPQFAGYSINGLKMEPGTAGTCTDTGMCNEAGGGAGVWRMEALSANKWDFGVDSNHSHVQPTGEYHRRTVAVDTPEGPLACLLYEIDPSRIRGRAVIEHGDWLRACPPAGCNLPR
jgi:hypothetical protein